MGSKKAALPTLPAGFQVKDGMAFGSRQEGCLEISLWNVKQKNSITGEGQARMGQLIRAAQNDDNVKVILVHGGMFFSAGNDLKALAAFGGTDLDDVEKETLASHAVEHLMVSNLMSILKSKKPIVGLVRGQAIGIMFTTLALFDFLYVTPDAKFSTPFMRSFQSPEGASTFTFPQQFGIRRANEILLLDSPVTAQEAVQSGFANGVISDLNNDHWPDLQKIPALQKLLATDLATLVNCKQLINAARDNARIEQTITREARALVDTWLHKDFPPKLMQFMADVMSKKPAPKL